MHSTMGSLRSDLLWYEPSTQPMLTFERPHSEFRYCQTDERFGSECLYILVIPLIVILREKWLADISSGRPYIVLCIQVLT